MREFRIKVNNEKTYVVKANDYNQAVKTLHSKLRDFDDTKKNINVVREFITNNGGKFSKSKDADAILDFIYKKTGVKNADYGDVLYIVRNYTNVKVDDNTINDKPIKKWVLQSTINPILYLDEDKVAVPGAYRGKQFITKSDAEKWYYSIMSEPLGSKNATFKVVEEVVANDSSINDLVSKYNGEDAIRTNGFVKIKEDGDWTSYKYNGSDFDDAVFKIHQYNPSLIAFISNGNRTITVRNKYLNDADDTAQGEIEVLKSFGFDYKDGRWVKESNNNTIIAQPDYHYVSVIGPGDTEKHCKKYQYQSAGMLKKIIASNIKDSSIKDVSYVSGKKLKIGQKIVEDGEVLEVVDIKETQRGVNNNYRDITFKNVKTGATETVHFGNSTLARLNDKLIESGSKQALSKNIATEIKSGKDPKQAAAIAYSVQRENDSSIKDVDWDFANKLKQHSQEEIRNALKYSAPTVYKQYRNGETIQFAGLAGQLTGPEKTKVLKRLGDSNILSGYKFRIINNGTKWYYETTFPDGHTTLTGPYSSKQETEQYFHKHRPTEKLTDANRYNKGQKFQTSAGIHEIIGYDPVKADVTTNRIEYSYRIKTPNGTYTNMPDWQLEELVKLGRYKLIDSSIQDADPVKVEKIIRKEKSALGITYYLFQTKSNSGATIYFEVTDKTYHGEPTYSGGGVISFSLKTANDSLDSHLLSDKLKAKYGEKEGTNRYLRGENDSAVKDSNNIKNRKSYTIKVGDKQYKVFAESESEAINKYIKSKKQ